MPVIDADAHVVECERTWSYMDESDAEFKPVLVTIPGQTGRNALFWHIDGKLANTGPVSETDMVKAIREMDDVPGRLRHMDELGTDVQVLYPTIFLRPLTNRPEVERALCRSYNRWLAARCEEGQSRLRWAVVLPTRIIDEAIAELRFGKEHGACAVFMRGIENDRLPSNPYFYPIYEETERLDLPICVHAATSNFYVHDLFPEDGGLWRFKVPGINAFHALLSKAVPEKFPKLRFGFVELSVQWVPYVLHDYVRRASRTGRKIDPTTQMQANRMYVACQTDDDLPYVLKYAGEDNLVAGTDYGHADTSSELEALKNLRNEPGVAPQVFDKILGANAQALYGL